MVAQNRATFKARSQENHSRQIRTTLTTSDTIALEGMGTIYSFSIDATIFQPREASFTRIVLEDTEGHNYLVAESDWFRFDTITVNLDRYCEETALLEGITPLRLKCYLAGDATLTLNGIYSSSQPATRKAGSPEETVESIKLSQVQDIVDRINAYNREHGILWRAGITTRSLLNYMMKTEFSGEQDAYIGNIQFYSDGIYQIGELDNSYNLQRSQTDSSLFVPDFDWRHRHGRNMMTPVKDQGHSGYCVAFAINGMLEARTNLYFNNKLDFDLSEQDIVYNYAREGHKALSNIYSQGMNTYTALGDVVNNGVLDEQSVPFVDMMQYTIPPRPTGNECVQISNHLIQTVSDSFSSRENLKNLLIHQGPIVSGFGKDSTWHAVTMVGYHTIQAGDTIRPVKILSEGGLFDPIIVPNNSPLIGDTYWVMKDSYGLSEPGRQEGYLYLWFKTYSRMSSAQYTTSPIICRNYTVSDIMCEDLDGDGYFNWGIGPRPDHCPEWAPDEPDGDDSDATLGPMDEYGYIAPIQTDSTIYIDVNTQYSNGSLHLSNNICIRNGSTLTISCDLLMNRLAEIRIKPGSKLIVTGTIRNANIKPEPGSTLILNDGGRIITHAKDEFSVPVGAHLEINEGSVE